MSDDDDRISIRDAKYFVVQAGYRQMLAFGNKKEAIAKAKELARFGTFYVLKKVAGYQPAVEKIEETGNE